MKMNDEKELPVGQEIAWRALNDIELLKNCIPGCESIEQQGEGEYVLLINASVGPVRAKFKGQMRIKDVVAPTSYTLEFNGNGGAVGHGRGEAAVALVPLTPGTTLLRYTASATVGGKLAQVGSRLIDMAAQKMASDFFASFLSELNKRHSPASPPVTASIDASSRFGWWARFVAWITGHFSRHA